MSALTQLVTAFLGSLGFAMLFGIRDRFLVSSALGGMLTWGIYMAFSACVGPGFIACFAASSFAIVYAELLAKCYKTPAILFVMPSIVPLVPGSSLYYAMSEAVQGNMLQARSYGFETLLFALAIACGICFVTAIRDLKRQ
ncbi:MAG: threonine/serine exporter family protein [Mogibacterium sp.]|nr:threonine/serine exporter family protein [Mogibacterium sp.]